MKNELTIFYTDDDQDDLEFFKEIIEDIDGDYNVVTQANAEQLLQVLDNPPPTPYVVFLDINMPGMTGIEALHIIRQSEDHKTLPIVMFSTSNDEDMIEKSREMGASFYVPKSSAFEELKKSIEHTLKINWNIFKPAKNNFVYSY